ncbi:MAG: septum formation initiator family protein [Verrucomicrobiales bacterium]|jgi:cell division protein FtsB|nr:septum formation initiator family protein [Verrucomicrobiales bacterium]MBP9225693.1 septum formation initiator family protein [Verrucomicrobiales bacterium]HQZ29622.1 septum formation initiator family protein [Verrucomicrobiales bacterium]
MRDPEFQDNLELSLRIDEGGAKPHSNIWKRLSRVMEVVIYALLVLAVIKLFGPEMDRQEELKVEKQRIVHIRDEREQKVVRLRQEHRLLKTDKAYLETVARDRLNLQREGEFIIRIGRGVE